MFENYRVFKTDLAGKPISFEVGKMCGLSNGSCLVRYGETTVLCNVTASQKPRDGIDFFPLSVDFEEKLYAVGKIPGSFLKREGRPSEKAILASRMVDRPIRPLFPKDMRNDVSVVMTVMSVDPDCQPEVAGMIGTSFALSISDIPWNGPVAGVNVGLVDGEIIICPDEAQRAVSDMLVTVVGSAEKIVMIEAGANEVDDDTMLEAIMKAHEECKKMVAFISDVQKEIGKEKFTFESQEIDHDLFEAIKEYAIDRVKYALDTDDKVEREARLAPIVEDIHQKFEETHPDQAAQIDECIYKLQKFIVRRWLLDEGKRVDGRKLDEMRPLAAEVGVLPRVHGSGMFTRGQTQVLTVATLGSMSAKRSCWTVLTMKKPSRYMHHYNFPSYSVGETRPSRGPGRREIGHGALGPEGFGAGYYPLKRNSRTQCVWFLRCCLLMALPLRRSICGSTLALMDAGVPIKAPVAGISCGLITEGDRWMTMVDIQGLEDFYGDMDFKVGGTHKGITAIQMDLKIDGLTPEIIKEAFAKTHKARDYILDEIILKAIPAPREELSDFAPKMTTLKIDVEKIRDVIGQGGKVIQKICAECNVKIDIEEDGRVFISAINKDDIKRAADIVELIAKDPGDRSHL